MVGGVLLSEVFPEVLDRVKFGAVRRLMLDEYRRETLQLLACVPGGRNVPKLLFLAKNSPFRSEIQTTTLSLILNWSG